MGSVGSFARLLRDIHAIVLFTSIMVTGNITIQTPHPFLRCIASTFNSVCFYNTLNRLCHDVPHAT